MNVLDSNSTLALRKFEIHLQEKESRLLNLMYFLVRKNVHNFVKPLQCLIVFARARWVFSITSEFRDKPFAFTESKFRLRIIVSNRRP